MFPKPGNDVAKGRYGIRIGLRIWVYKERGASEIEAYFDSKCCYKKVPEVFSILEFLCIKFKKIRTKHISSEIQETLIRIQRDSHI